MTARTSDLDRDYRYEMVLRLRFGEWERRYWVEGRDGAVEFWVRTTPAKSDNDHKHYGGFEVHSAIPTAGPPDHPRCPRLSDRACWHDGSSTYATEFWIPHFESSPEDHEGLFRLLLGEYQKRFECDGDGN